MCLPNQACWRFDGHECQLVLPVSQTHIQEHSLFSPGFDFSNKKNLEKSTKPVASWTDIPEYKKILKNTVEEFISALEDPDYEEFENLNKKEITEHFDKFFRDPEFDSLISKAND